MTTVTVSETVFNVTVAETDNNVTVGTPSAINVSVNATDLATTVSQPAPLGVEVVKSLENNILTVRKLRSSGNDISISANADDIDFVLSDTITVDLNGNLKASTTNIAGHLVPETDDTHDLGSTTKRFRDLYLGPGSLFINNQKVLEDDSGVIKISSTNNLSVEAGGDLTLLSTNNTSTLQDTTINLGPSANNGTVNIRGTLEAPDLHVGDLEFTASTIDQTTSNQNLTISTNGTGFTHLKTADVFIGAGDPASGEFVKIDENSISKQGGGSLTLTGSVTGQVSDISNHLLDEDNFASDSATKAPSQQSVKAYIATQIATKDNTDEITEGSSNLYFTDARARAAISEDSTQLAYNSSTGVLTYTQGDTDTVSEGSSNLYFTTARARASISASGSLAYNSSTGALTYTQGNTDTVAEGSSNLYFTNARADARIQAASILDLADISGDAGSGKLLVGTGSGFAGISVNTDGFAEGSSNLFHTDARAVAAVEAEATLDLTGTVTVTGSAATKNTTIGDSTVGGSFAVHGFTVNAGDTCWAGVNLRETTGGAGKPITNFSNPTFGATVFGGTEAAKTGVESGKRIVVVQGLASQDGSEPTSANARFMFETSQQQTSSARGALFKLDTCSDDSTSTTTSIQAHGGIITFNTGGDATLKSGGDLTLDDAVIITGTLDAQDPISNSTGDVEINDNLKVNDNLTVDGNTVLGNANTDTITANGKLSAVNGFVNTVLNTATANTLAGLGIIDEGAQAYISDGNAGGKCMAFFDGSNWKKMHDPTANISSS
tara:strand:+ start:12702 stop:15044 length:2343 start_codon:yes stop_codon:yes gene_type:complete